MAWVKLDDAMPHHPKVMAAGAQAFALDVAGIAYSNRFATDGFIGKDQLPAVLPCLTSPRKWASKLVQVGRWHEVDDGWQIHDVDDYQPSAADQEAEREKARERMRKVRERKRSSGEQEANGSGGVRTNGERSSGYPVPSRPVLEPEPNGSGGKPPSTLVEGFDLPFPTKPADEPMYLRLRTWAVESGFERPADRNPSVQWQWLMSIVDEVLGDGKYSHGVRVALCGEFAEHVTERVPDRDAWQHLRQLVKLHGGGQTLEWLGEACQWGAGTGKWADDPLGLTKYVAGIAARSAA